MKPVMFKEVNKAYGENQKEYYPLPVLEVDGIVMSCWKLSFKERLRILFTGKVWLALHMLGKPLTPSFLTTKKSDLLIEERL